MYSNASIKPPLAPSCRSRSSDPHAAAYRASKRRNSPRVGSVSQNFLRRDVGTMTLPYQLRAGAMSSYAWPQQEPVDLFCAKPVVLRVVQSCQQQKARAHGATVHTSIANRDPDETMACCGTPVPDIDEPMGAFGVFAQQASRFWARMMQAMTAGGMLVSGYFGKANWQHGGDVWRKLKTQCEESRQALGRTLPPNALDPLSEQLQASQLQATLHNLPRAQRQQAKQLLARIQKLQFGMCWQKFVQYVEGILPMLAAGVGLVALAAGWAAPPLVIQAVYALAHTLRFGIWDLPRAMQPLHLKKALQPSSEPWATEGQKIYEARQRYRCRTLLLTAACFAVYGVAAGSFVCGLALLQPWLCQVMVWPFLAAVLAVCYLNNGPMQRCWVNNQDRFIDIKNVKGKRALLRMLADKQQLQQTIEAFRQNLAARPTWQGEILYQLGLVLSYVVSFGALSPPLERWRHQQRLAVYAKLPASALCAFVCAASQAHQKIWQEELQALHAKNRQHASNTTTQHYVQAMVNVYGELAAATQTPPQQPDEATSAAFLAPFLRQLLRYFNAQDLLEEYLLPALSQQVLAMPGATSTAWLHMDAQKHAYDVVAWEAALGNAQHPEHATARHHMQLLMGEITHHLLHVEPWRLQKWQGAVVDQLGFLAANKARRQAFVQGASESCPATPPAPAPPLLA